VAANVVPWRLSRSVIESVGLAVAEFARNAEYELVKRMVDSTRKVRRTPGYV